MKVLITGHTGFIGQNLVEYLLAQQKHTLFLPDRSSIIPHIKEYKPDVIIHLAGNPIKSAATYEESMVLHEDNLLLTHKLLASIEHKCRFVFASSTVVYGNADSYYRLSEVQDARPESIYAGSKLAAEVLCKTYANLNKVDILILRYCTNVGKHATYGVLIDIIKKLRSSDEKLKLWGSCPGSKRPYINVLDSAAVTAEISTSKDTGIYNICLEDTIDIAAIAFIVQHKLGIFKDIEWQGNNVGWQGDQKHLVLSNAKIMTKYSQFIKYRSAKEAISKAIDDILDGEKQ